MSSVSLIPVPEFPTPFISPYIYKLFYLTVLELHDHIGDLIRTVNLATSSPGLETFFFVLSL